MPVFLKPRMHASAPMLGTLLNQPGIGLQEQPLSRNALYKVCLAVGLLGVIFAWRGPMAYIGYGVGALLMLGMLFLPLRVVLMLMLVVLVGPDIVEGQSEVAAGGAKLVGSPWRLGIGPMTPGMLHGLVYIAALRHLRVRNLMPVARPFALYSIIVGVIGAGVCVGTWRTAIPVSTMISDLRMVLFWVIAIMIWRGGANAFPERMYKFAQVLLVVFTVRLFCDAGLWISGAGAFLSGASRGGLDSTQWATLVLVFWSIHSLACGRHIVIAIVVVALSGAIVVVGMERMSYVTCICGVVIILFVARKVTRVFLAVGVFLGTVVVGIGFMHLVMPNWLEVYSVRFGMTWHLTRLDFRSADEPRYMETRNLIGEMTSDGSILTGRGFGGTYTDSIEWMGNDLVDAYSESAADSRRFDTVHYVFGQFILKFGLIGLSLWVTLWARLCLQLARASGLKPHWEQIRVVLLSVAPAVFFSGYWSSKGMICTALFMVFAEFVYTNHICREARPDMKAAV